MAHGLTDAWLTGRCLAVRVWASGRGYLSLALLALATGLTTGLVAASTLSSPPLRPARVSQNKQRQDSAQEKDLHFGACVCVD